MLTVVHIAHLVTDNTGVPDSCINVGMRMAKYPNINSAICNKITQLGCKGAVQQASFMLGCDYLQCGKVVCNHHYVLSIALGHTLFDKCQTFLVLYIEIISGESSTSIQYLPEVVHTTTNEIFVLW